MFPDLEGNGGNDRMKVLQVGLGERHLKRRNDVIAMEDHFCHSDKKKSCIS